MESQYRNRYRVESARRKGFDYSRPGSYFVTICTKNKQHLFGEIIPGDQTDQNEKSQKMILNEYGKIVHDCWYDLPNHYPYIRLDAFTVMPDHVHGIIIIDNPLDDNKYHGLSEFVRAFKSFSSRRISELRKGNNTGIWQSRYYDHIIIGHDDLSNIRNYIIKNPDNWEFHDTEIPYIFM
jgi:REP element-mobilizing transposase RayT